MNVGKEITRMREWMQYNLDLSKQYTDALHDEMEGKEKASQKRLAELLVTNDYLALQLREVNKKLDGV